MEHVGRIPIWVMKGKPVRQSLVDLVMSDTGRAEYHFNPKLTANFGGFSNLCDKVRGMAAVVEGTCYVHYPDSPTRRLEMYGELLELFCTRVAFATPAAFKSKYIKALRKSIGVKNPATISLPAAYYDSAEGVILPINESAQTLADDFKHEFSGHALLHKELGEFYRCRSETMHEMFAILASEKLGYTRTYDSNPHKQALDLLNEISKDTPFNALDYRTQREMLLGAYTENNLVAIVKGSIKQKTKQWRDDLVERLTDINYDRWRPVIDIPLYVNSFNEPMGAIQPEDLYRAVAGTQSVDDWTGKQYLPYRYNCMQNPGHANIFIDRVLHSIRVPGSRAPKQNGWMVLYSVLGGDYCHLWATETIRGGEFYACAVKSSAIVGSVSNGVIIAEGFFKFDSDGELQCSAHGTTDALKKVSRWPGLKCASSPNDYNLVYVRSDGWN